MKTLVLHITGMNCPSCEKLVEMELAEARGVASAKASLGKKTVEVTGDFGEKTSETIARELTSLLQKHGFGLSSAAP